MDGPTALVIGGGALQVVGFGLIAWDLAETQWREIGAPAVIERWRGRLRRLFRRTKTVTAAANLEIKVGGSAAATVEASAPDQSVEGRLGALERNVSYLREELLEHRQKVGKELDEQKGALAKLTQSWERRDADREAARKLALKSSLARQGWGTACFAIGTILAVVGGLD